VSATDETERTLLTAKVFGMVGGVAFLTLVINGSSSGRLLAKLGLADSTETRKRIAKSAEEAARRRSLDDFINLMTDPRFAFVDFALGTSASQRQNAHTTISTRPANLTTTSPSLVMHHCPLLKDLRADELGQALKENKESVHPSSYKQPNLDNVLLYIPDSGKLRRALGQIQREAFMDGDLGSGIPLRHDIFTLDDEMSETDHEGGKTEDEDPPSPEMVKDIRLMFVELLRASYQAQLRDGELDAREYNGFLSYILLQSCDFAHDAANAGKPLNDWRASHIASPEMIGAIEDAGMRFYRCCCKKTPTPEGSSRLFSLRDEQPLRYQQIRLDVLRAFSFIDAHKEAQGTCVFMMQPLRTCFYSA